MAISKSDGSIILTTAISQAGLNKGLSSMKGSIAKFGAASVAFFGVIAGAITKQAVDAFANYEQLVGGVETLFKGSADKVKAYAENAFVTTGQSANEYMRQVTSFSASLIRSTAGDTDKAADIANMALIDISDNVNKLGSTQESVTLAYQGFAKQQYMLLDNLKLGYGGTKTEMERLLKDAQAITGIKYDISNLADVYTAIHVIQEQLGITGTTAKEAEKTISGSAKAMKASWENLVSSVAGGGDIDKAIDNFARSVAVYFENIVPVVERALQGVGYLIERLAPLLVQRLSAALMRSIPQLLSAVYQMIISLAKGVYEGITALFKGTATETIKEQSEAIAESVKNQQQLTEAVEETEKAQKGSLADFDQIKTLSKETAEMEELPAFSVGEMLPTTEEVEPIEIQVKVKNTTKAEQEIRKMFSSIGQMVQPVKDSLVDLFAPMVDDVQYIWDEILTPFSDWIIDTFAPAFASNLANSIDTVTESNETLRDSIKSFWEEDLKPIVEDIGDIIETIMAKTDEALQYFQKKMSEHKDSLASVIDGIGVIIGVLWKFIKPLFEFLVNQTFDSFKNVTDGIFAIIEYFGNLFNVIKNIMGGIVALCKGNFEEAGEYFKNAGKAFVNIWIGILNLIISGINELWSWIFNSFKSGVNAIGGVIEKVGGYLGADWDLHWDAQAPLIPDIPYLAKGAVIPGGREFLAVLGDQPKGQTNIEAPLDTIKQALAEVLAQVNVNNGDVPPIIINVDIDGKNLLNIMRSAEDRYGNQIITGGFANA